LAEGFLRHSDDEYTLEEVRDHLRCCLHRHSANNFTWGQFTSVDISLNALLKTDIPILSSCIYCPQRHPVSRQLEASHNCHIDVGRIDFESVQDELDLFVTALASKCTVCNDFLL